MREKRKSKDVREEPFGNTALFLQRMQKILHAGPEEAGNPGRNASVGHQNVLCGGTTGLKKTAQNLEANYRILDLDEMYWFIGKKSRTKTRENNYIMTMVSRLPRQIVGFDAAFDKSPKRIQSIVDNAPESENYCSDGWSGYVDVAYPGQYIRNVCNKNDPFTVEGVNADLRHYIPVLAGRSRCFPRKLETLRAVLEVFVEAYNKFGTAKMKFRQGRNPNSRELPFSVLDFL